MSQDNKNKTMIGTMAPIIPRSRPPVGNPQPPTNPPAPAPPTAAPHAPAPHAPAPHAGHDQPTIMPGAPPPHAGHDQPTIMPGAPAPTVGMRPRAEPSGGYPTGHGQPPAYPTGHGQPPAYPTGHGQPPPQAQPQGYPTGPGQPPGYPTGQGHPTNPGGYPTGPGGSMHDPGDPDLFVGQELGGYTIKRKLAEGGMGVVFEGEHGKIGRRGAIKVLKLEFCRSEDVVERFRQEARAVNAIRHENIVDIYDFGRDPYGRVFFVMEYLEGEPLSSRIRRGAVPWSEAFPILEQTLRALKAAHEKGFVHRDLKPDNIWLKYVEGRIEVKLLDFGIAKLVGSESPREKLTQTGSVIGTPHYMSPEQINGSRDVDHRTDIYAMGVITYEMFAGVTPFVGDTLQAIMTGHLFKDPPRLAEVPANLGVPPPIAEIVDRMLVKDAAGRYDSVTDVLGDLHDVNAHRWPARAETLSRERPTRPSMQLPMQGQLQGQAQAQVALPAAAPRGKGRRAGAIVGGLAAAGLAIAGVAIWQSQQGSKEAVVADPPLDPPLPPGPRKPEPRALDYDALRKDAQTTMRASLDHAEPAVRVDGSDAIGQTKHQPAEPKLTELTEKDPDPEVRGHAGEALGTIGAASAAPLLTKLEAAAPPPLKVWYASALARLGDQRAHGRLLDYARSKDLAVSFKAGLTLAEISKPGDKKAIKALQGLAAREAELHEIRPYAGALLLSKMAALRDPAARKTLYALLERDHEGARLAAAEGLAQLGDDAGKQVLQEVLANEKSPLRLEAAVALIPLGEYGGVGLITAQLDAKDPDTRRIAAHALGAIGDPKSLEALIARASDPDWRMRVAAAAAIVAIVGLDPQVLAQASVDWTKSALGSKDRAVRTAAAGVLADIPEKEAVPLLAQAIADPDQNVRLAAARSAGKMKSPAAAKEVVAVVKAEKDPAVKEQQVKALGEIGSDVAKDTLAQIAKEDLGRLGVIASGSLIAVGDPSGKDRLEAAVQRSQPEDLRLAAVQAASSARNQIVVPTLKTGILDRVLGIRLTAAEGLAGFGAEKDDAVKVLEEVLDKSKDPGVLSRAMAALMKLGAPIPSSQAQSPADLLNSEDPKQRLAAVPIVRAMPASEGVPLLRRLVSDPDQEVRRAGVDAIEAVATSDKEEAIKLYKPLVSDADPVVRSKASGQLSRLAPPLPAPPEPTPPKTAATTPDPAPPEPAPAPALDPKIPEAAAKATAAAAEARPTAEALKELAAELERAVASSKGDEDSMKNVEQLEANIRQAAATLEAAATTIEAAAKAAADAAGASPPPDAAKLVVEAKALAVAARGAATAARDQVAEAEKLAKKHKDTWTDDPQFLITGADTAIAARNFPEAKKNLDKAAKLLRQLKKKNPSLDYSYGQLYDNLAKGAQDPAKKLALLKQAKEAYERFAKAGRGQRAQVASERITLLTGAIAKLEQP